MTQRKFENWRPGVKSGTVICDTPIGGDKGHDDLDYYEGHLVAESIPYKEWVVAISALPELLAAAKGVLGIVQKYYKSDDRGPTDSCTILEEAIAKIEGRKE